MTRCESHCGWDGCDRMCVAEGVHDRHLCNGIHYCNELCDNKKEGYCEVSYDEDGVLRPAQRRCRRILLPSQTTHSGPHRCTLQVATSHLCCTPCPTCRHPCVLEYNHTGKHKTDHGIVTIPHVSPDDVRDTKSPISCKDLCLQLGEGHYHYVAFGTGVRPASDMLGFDVTHHKHFWSDWTDPCEDEAHQHTMHQCRQQCSLCTTPSQCVLEALHTNPHSFNCTHNKHIIFLIDYSKSTDPGNKLRQIRDTVSSILSHRSTCTDVYSTIIFNTKNTTIFEKKQRSAVDIVKQTADIKQEGGTKYSLGLDKVRQVVSALPKTLQSQSVAVLISDGKSSKKSGVNKPIATAHNSAEISQLPENIPIHCVELRAADRYFSKMTKLSQMTGGIVTDADNLNPLLDAITCCYDPGVVPIQVEQVTPSVGLRTSSRRSSIRFVSTHTPGVGMKSALCDVSLIDAEVSYVRTLEAVLGEKHPAITKRAHLLTEMKSIHSSLLGVYRAHPEGNMFVGILRALESLSTRIISVYSEYISSFQSLVEEVSDDGNLQLLVTAPIQRLPRFKLTFTNIYKKNIKNKGSEDEADSIIECEEKVRELLLTIEKTYRA